MDAAIQEPTTTGANRRWEEAEEQIGVLRDLLQGGEILPTQLPAASYWTPEVRLAAAVLGQAVADIRWRRADARDHIQVNAALRWVRSNDSTWPFSFIRVCELLRLEPLWVRGRVSRWMRGAGDNGRAVVRQAA
jgi:hypothetical protein